jgi:hypothetical protein
VNKRELHEYVVANLLKQMRRECAADRQAAEARMRQLLEVIDEFIRWHWQQLEAAGHFKK